MPRGTMLATTERKIRFLLDNPSLIEKVSIGDRPAVEAMKDAGLVSRVTYWMDARSVVITARSIHAARKSGASPETIENMIKRAR